MKLLYSRVGRLLITAVLFITLNTSVKAQTTLVLGDIAFTGYHSATAATDSFSFVLLRSITAGTVINFTDNGWLSPGSFRGGETTVIFTSIALPAGREIIIGGLTARQAGNGTSAGTVTGSALSLSTTGDQIFAYQGTVATPTLISGIQMNVATVAPGGDCVDANNTDWDGTCSNSSNASWKPPVFNGAASTAVWIGTFQVSASEFDNARFTNCAATLTTATDVRNAIINQANWDPTNRTNTNPPGFPLGSNCAFMGLFPLPVKLISFTGKLNSDKTVTLQWKVADQQDAQEFTVEESADGSSYRTLGTVTPGAGDTYSLVDAQVATGKNYYRLKTLELSGKIIYSNVIVINLKAGIVISLYPNPVTDKLTIQQFGTIQNKKAILADQQGRVVQHISLTNLQQTVNMERYAAGIYTLKLEDGTTYKIVKE